MLIFYKETNSSLYNCVFVCVQACVSLHMGAKCY